MPRNTEHQLQTNPEENSGSAPPQGATPIGQAVENVQQEVQTARRPWYALLRQARFLLGIYLILLALFVGLAFFVSVHPILAIDVTITRWVQESTLPGFRPLMFAVSYPGNTLWLSIGPVVVATLVFWLLRFRLEAAILLLINISSALLNLALKLLINRPRPSQTLVSVFQRSPGLSFPSGHVMAYVAFWGVIFVFILILFTGRRWWRLGLLIFSGLVIILVGPSRVYLGDHWTSDVLGSYLLSGLWLGLWLWIYVQFKERGVLAASHTSDRPDAVAAQGK